MTPGEDNPEWVALRAELALLACMIDAMNDEVHNGGNS